jgi:hypothetical protein
MDVHGHQKYFSHIASSRKIILARKPGSSWYLASCLLWHLSDAALIDLLLSLFLLQSAIDEPLSRVSAIRLTTKCVYTSFRLLHIYVNYRLFCHQFHQHSCLCLLCFNSQLFNNSFFFFLSLNPRFAVCSISVEI